MIFTKAIQIYKRFQNFTQFKNSFFSQTTSVVEKRERISSYVLFCWGWHLMNADCMMVPILKNSIRISETHPQGQMGSNIFYLFSFIL